LGHNKVIDHVYHARIINRIATLSGRVTQCGENFFLTPSKGPHFAPRADPLRESVIALRKQSLSVYDISRSLTNQGHPLSAVAVAQILKDEGFARLPRRADDERPPGSRPTTADVADIRQLDLSSRSFRTKFGGLFLFLPILASIPLDRILKKSGFPGSEMIPPGSAMRSLLALKLFGTARNRHKLTTYANLSELNRLGIQFITLRRRSPGLKQEIDQTLSSAWRRIELKGVSRKYKNPRILDGRIGLTGYDGPLRQVTATDLGHEEPTVLLTNQLTRKAANLAERYAQRMIIEHSIADGIDFFHMDALSSAVAMKVNCDLQLTLMASSLYRLLAGRIGQGYEHAKSRHLFQDFVDATAQVTITESDIVVRFQKRAHNPLLVAAGFDTKETAIPWLGGKRLKLLFG
jgi:hypothetical protein